MAKRYNKEQKPVAKRKQVVLSSVAIVFVAIVLAGVIVKANQGIFRNTFNAGKITVSSSVVSSNESEVFSSDTLSSEILSSVFSSEAVEVFNVSSNISSSKNTSSKPTATPTATPTKKPTPTPAPTMTPMHTPTHTPTPPEDIPLLTIMGPYDRTLTAQKMADFISPKNPVLNCTPLELANYYLAEGEIEGVRGDIAFCQAIKETNWFRFTGDVKSDQNNFCGLGATGNGAEGEHFSSPQIGVRAHIQHLKVYGSTSALNQEKVDPRFGYVLPRGKALKWTDLGGKWAVPGYDMVSYISYAEAFNNNATYGQLILQKYSDLLK